MSKKKGHSQEMGASTSLTAEHLLRVNAQIGKWRDELITAGKGNRLLYYKPSRTSSLQITAPEEGTILARLQEGRKGWSFFEPLPSTTSTKHAKPTEIVTDKRDQDSLDSALTGLSRRSAQAFMEKGISVLYLTLGRLNWKDPKEDEPAKSPLVLVPIVIERESPRDPYVMRLGEDDPVLNPVLAIKLRVDFGIELPVLEDFTGDDGRFDFDGLWQATKKAIAKQKEWTVTREMTIGIFSFHKEVMFRDLQENASLIQEHPAVQALVLGSDVGGDFDFEPIPHEQLDERCPPEQLVSILDADATQRTAIAAAKERQSFVIDGPPGTGKSQTIANIIAELAHDGKHILFVSEKVAALDVVAERLTSRGLGDYVFKLHSGKITRKEVAQELARSLSEHPRPPPAMAESDIARLTNRRLALSDYAAAMNEVRRPLGRSLQQVLGHIAKLQHLPHAPPSPNVGLDLTPQDIEDIKEAAGRLSDAWDPIDKAETFHWRDATNEPFNSTTRQRLELLLKHAANAARDLKQTADSAAADLRVPWSVETAEHADRLLKLLDHAAQRPPGVPQTWAEIDPAALRRRLAERLPLLEDMSKLEAELLKRAGKDWAQLSPDVHNNLMSTLAHLSKSDIPWRVSDDATEAKLRSAVELLQDLPVHLRNVADQAKLIAPDFGFNVSSLSLEDARRLAELGKLASAPALPEPRWFEPHTIPILRQAVGALEQTINDYTRLERELRVVYKPTILEQDLEGIAARYETVHRHIFAFLSKQYREDKKAVAACTHEGRVSPRVKQTLRQAHEWQQVRNKLIALERRSSGITGGHYYKGTETNFEDLRSALDVANKALDLVGEQLDRKRLAKTLSVEATRDPATPLRATQLLDSVIAVSAALESAFGESARVVTKVPIDRARAWCEAILADVQKLLDIVSESRLGTNYNFELADLKNASKDRKHYHTLALEVQSTNEEDTAVFGPLWRGAATDPIPLAQAIAWVEELHVHYGPGLQGPAARRFLLLDPTEEVEPFRKRLRDLLRVWADGRGAAVDAFAEKAKDDVRHELDSSFRAAAAYLDILRHNLAQIAIWQDFARAKRDLDNAGLSPVVAYCESQIINRKELVAVIERSILERWADIVLKDDKRLGETRAESRDRLVEEFKALDRKLIEAASARVMTACNARRPRTNYGGVGVIVREGNKKKKHMPIKSLLSEAGPVVQAIKPCFMMSPLTVSQFLPPDLKFDVVIFDEASQVIPSDAINCIYRGNQLIVAGDQKQLPPTSFFHSLGEDSGEEYEEGQLDTFESILDQCKSSGFRSISLGWHYRSQHEHLITFSNHRFYSSRLITFPSSQQEDADLGIAFLHVPEGVYDRGARRDNPNEAKAVVQRILFHARNHPNLSLGVVALSEPQMSAIEAELARERSKPENMGLDSYFAEDRLKGFFVKNLENVQGDERDIVLISIGYGKDKDGKLSLNFGPINKGAGWRRLNVAVTRAKRRVEVVSSIAHLDFPVDLPNESVRHLRDYLRFAQEGPEFLIGTYTTEMGGFDSPFEEEVASAVRGWGHSVASQVGTAGYRIDLAIRDPKNPSRYVLGIECDGAMYHSGKVARDRDRLREAVLQNLGWRLHRIWGTAWYRDREKAEKQLREAINDAINAAPPRRASSELAVTPPPASRDEVELTERPGWVVPYKESRITEQYFPGIGAPDAQIILKRTLLQVVKIEGPVSWDLAQRRIFNAWGIQARARAQDAFERAALSLEREGQIAIDDRKFLTIPGRSLGHVRIHEEGSTPRKIEDVPREEMASALLTYVQDAKKMGREELTRRVAALFGWKRRGSEIQSTLDDLLESLVECGALREVGDHFEYGRDE